MITQFSTHVAKEKLKINTVIKLFTLVLLYDGPKHGYELMKFLEVKLGTRIGPSQVYPFLRQLEKHGLLRSVKVGPREKKIYELTTEGKYFVKDLLERAIEVIQTSVKALGPERVCP